MRVGIDPSSGNGHTWFKTYGLCDIKPPKTNFDYTAGNPIYLQLGQNYVFNIFSEYLLTCGTSPNTIHATKNVFTDSSASITVDPSCTVGAEDDSIPCRTLIMPNSLGTYSGNMDVYFSTGVT